MRLPTAPERELDIWYNDAKMHELCQKFIGTLVSDDKALCEPTSDSFELETVC